MEAAERTEDLTLDSAHLVALELTHASLKSGLKKASPLNVTQYRMLVKLLAASPNAIAQAELGPLLNLKENVVTQAANVLESHGFAERRASADDKRARTIRITDEGVEHIAQVNTSIVERLYAIFPTDNEVYRRILEASIVAGAAIDPPLTDDVAKRYPASRALVSLELINRIIEDGFVKACGASYSECRILQRLGEVDTPLRSVDLADQLQLSAVTIARATDRLVSRGWAQRLGSPRDRKAVFVAATEGGQRQQAVIAETLNSLAEKYLWSKLDYEHRQAISQADNIVMKDLQQRKETERLAALQARKEAERETALGPLVPLDR